MNAEHVAEILELRALTDDLAARLGIYAEEFEMHEDIEVLARYREARQR